MAETVLLRRWSRKGGLETEALQLGNKKKFNLALKAFRSQVYLYYYASASFRTRSESIHKVGTEDVGLVHKSIS